MARTTRLSPCVLVGFDVYQSRFRGIRILLVGAQRESSGIACCAQCLLDSLSNRSTSGTARIIAAKGMACDMREHREEQVWICDRRVADPMQLRHAHLLLVTLLDDVLVYGHRARERVAHLMSAGPSVDSRAQALGFPGGRAPPRTRACVPRPLRPSETTKGTDDLLGRPRSRRGSRRRRTRGVSCRHAP